METTRAHVCNCVCVRGRGSPYDQPVEEKAQAGFKDRPPQYTSTSQKSMATTLQTHSGGVKAAVRARPPWAGLRAAWRERRGTRQSACAARSGERSGGVKGRQGRPEGQGKKGSGADMCTTDGGGVRAGRLLPHAAALHGRDAQRASAQRPS